MTTFRGARDQNPSTQHHYQLTCLEGQNVRDLSSDCRFRTLPWNNSRLLRKRTQVGVEGAQQRGRIAPCETGSADTPTESVSPDSRRDSLRGRGRHCQVFAPGVCRTMPEVPPARKELPCARLSSGGFTYGVATPFQLTWISLSQPAEDLPGCTE